MTDTAKASAAQAADNDPVTDEDIWNELDETDDSTPDEQTDERDAVRQVDVEEDFDEDLEEDTGAATPEDTEDQDQHDPPDTDQAKAAPAERSSSTQSLDDLKTQNERLEQKFRSEQERAVGQQRRADRLQQELDELKRRLNSKTTDEDADDKLASVQEEYGDVVGPLIDQIKSLKGKVDGMSRQDERRVEQLQSEISDIEQEQIRIFHAEHSDGFAQVKANAGLFRQWIEDQPKRYRDMFERNRERMVDGTGAALLVSRFKQALAEADAAQGKNVDPPPKTDTAISPRRQAQLGGARSQRSRSSTPTSGAMPLTSGTDEEIWADFDRIDPVD